MTKLPVRQTPSSEKTAGRKLSEIIKEMALRLLKDPEAGSSEPAAMAVLTLAGAAWNSAIGDNIMRERHRELIDRIEWENVTPWEELRSRDTEQLIAEIVAYKREHYPNDLRRIAATDMSPEGNVRVHWTEPDKVAAAPFGAARPKTTTKQASKAASRRGQARQEYEAVGTNGRQEQDRTNCNSKRAAETFGERFVTKVLGRQLGLSQ